MTRVTVVVPAHNYAHFLSEALESVLAQTHEDWECVVVDDASTDDTAAVAQRYVDRDSRFRLVRHPANRGLSASRNTALHHATGDYVQFLDADDRLAPAKLAIHARFLDEHPRTDIVYSLATFFRTEEPGKVLYSLRGHLSRPLMQKVSGAAEALEKLEEMNIFVVASPLIRRSVVARAGAFNEQANACEDWDLWLRCARAGCHFEYLETGQPVAFIRTHPESMSRDTTRMMTALAQLARTSRITPLPRVYEVALGIEAVEQGRRAEGVRRIWRAARGARSFMGRWRWTAYAIAGATLPRRAFTWVVTRPMPERGLELLRRMRRVSA